MISTTKSNASSAVFSKKLVKIIVAAFVLFGWFFVAKYAANYRSEVVTSINGHANSLATQPSLDCHLTSFRAVYDILALGHWARSTEKVYTKPQLPLEELEIHVVPHSHIDPGWLMTFEEYYQKQVKDILNYMTEFMSENPKMRFIWSEMSYLDRWYEDADERHRNMLMSLLKRGQLELTGGAWVMTDEATPYFWASIDNMIEGHQFVSRQFGVSPAVGWSVDPFGHGSMMPLLNRLSDVRHMVTGRINMQQKTDMRSRTQLVFNWRQIWDTTNWTDTLTVMLPKMYYTTADTCGPDNMVCCKFDFGPSSRSHCGGSITAGNAVKNAQLLADQYRKLARWYRHPVVLVPVGDDFRYRERGDWEETHDYYSLLFDQINIQSHLKMEVKFSTLTEYFTSLKRNMAKTPVPALVGDFFPYMDFPHNYPWWTGYFTTHPYHKRLDRILQSEIRSADVLSALIGRRSTPSEWMTTTQPRRDMALFQHHDAITGTSRRHVMADYLQRIEKAGRKAQTIKVGMVGQLLGRIAGEKSTNLNETVIKVQTEGQPFYEEAKPIDVASGEKRVISVFNQLSRNQHFPVRIALLSPTVKVVRIRDSAVMQAQINPMFTRELAARDTYELVFVDELAPFSITKYMLLNTDPHMPASTIMAAVWMESTSSERSGIFEKFPRIEDTVNEIVLRSPTLTTHHHTKHGGIEAIEYATERKFEFNITFHSYQEKGGAYVFEPYNQRAEPISFEDCQMLQVVGVVESRLETHCAPIGTSYTLFHNGGTLSEGIHLELRPNMEKMANVDLVARVTDGRIAVDSASPTHFFTDVNGLQFFERTYNSNAAVEANYYPVSSAMILQGNATRLTLLTGQPHGATIKAPNQIEFMFDRVVSRNDGKGLAENEASVSIPSIQRIVILPEKLKLLQKARKSTTIYHSLVSHQTLETLLYPAEVYLQTSSDDDSNSGWLTPVGWQSLACDLQLINLRPMIDGNYLLLLRRLILDCDVVSRIPIERLCAHATVNALPKLLEYIGVDKVVETSLTGLHDRQKIAITELSSAIPPMNISTFRLEF